MVLNTHSRNGGGALHVILERISVSVSRAPSRVTLGTDLDRLWIRHSSAIAEPDHWSVVMHANVTLRV